MLLVDQDSRPSLVEYTDAWDGVECCRGTQLLTEEERKESKETFSRIFTGVIKEIPLLCLMKCGARWKKPIVTRWSKKKVMRGTAPGSRPPQLPEKRKALPPRVL